MGAVRRGPRPSPFSIRLPQGSERRPWASPQSRHDPGLPSEDPQPALGTPRPGSTVLGDRLPQNGSVRSRCGPRPGPAPAPPSGPTPLSAPTSGPAPASGRLPGGETLPCQLWDMAVWGGQGAPGQMRRGPGARGQGGGPGLSDVSQQLVLTPDRRGSRLGAHPASPSTHRCGPLPGGSSAARTLGHRGAADSAAAAKSLQSCPTLCDPIDGSPPGSSVPGILQARILEWVAIAFSNA